jgi:hypothetical protein
VTVTKNGASKNVVNSTSNDFAVEDVGQTISGTGIPSGTTITTYTSPTQVTMSANANANNTGTYILGTANTWSAATCTAAQSCMISVAFSGTNVVDWFSAPFYDYATDTLYAGDNGGFLHKFTGVFNGTPAETGSPWPVQPVPGIPSSPVYVSNGSGNIYMGDILGNESATPVGCTSATLYPRHRRPSADVFYGRLDDGIVDPPLVDSTHQTAVWFAAGFSTAAAGCGATGNAIAGVDQTNSSLDEPGVGLVLLWQCPLEPLRRRAGRHIR